MSTFNTTNPPAYVGCHISCRRAEGARLLLKAAGDYRARAHLERILAFPARPDGEALGPRTCRWCGRPLPELLGLAWFIANYTEQTYDAACWSCEPETYADFDTLAGRPMREIKLVGAGA